MPKAKKTTAKKTTTKAKDKYTFEFKINGETKTLKGSDIEKAILSVKPDMVLTESYFTIKTKDHTSERKLTTVHTRKVFNDPVFREIFINNLLLA